MTDTIILRFRDLVTNQGGTIHEHKRIIELKGGVWWGWWKKPAEQVPRTVLSELYERIEALDSHDVYLFDVGHLDFLYKAKCDSIRIAPTQCTIHSPEQPKTPEYYRGQEYPAWFHFTTITDGPAEITQANIKQPTVSGQQASTLDTPITDLNELKDTNVTIWQID